MKTEQVYTCLAIIPARHGIDLCCIGTIAVQSPSLNLFLLCRLRHLTETWPNTATKIDSRLFSAQRSQIFRKSDFRRIPKYFDSSFETKKLLFASNHLRQTAVFYTLHNNIPLGAFASDFYTNVCNCNDTCGETGIHMFYSHFGFPKTKCAFSNDNLK